MQVYSYSTQFCSNKAQSGFELKIHYPNGGFWLVVCDLGVSVKSLQLSDNSNRDEIDVTNNDDFSTNVSGELRWMNATEDRHIFWWFGMGRNLIVENNDAAESKFNILKRVEFMYVRWK